MYDLPQEKSATLLGGLGAGTKGAFGLIQNRLVHPISVVPGQGIRIQGSGCQVQGFGSCVENFAEETEENGIYPLARAFLTGSLVRLKWSMIALEPGADSTLTESTQAPFKISTWDLAFGVKGLCFPSAVERRQIGVHNLCFGGEKWSSTADSSALLPSSSPSTAILSPPEDAVRARDAEIVSAAAETSPK